MHGAKAGVLPCVLPKKANVRVECECGMRHAGCGRRMQVWHKMWMWQCQAVRQKSQSDEEECPSERGRGTRVAIAVAIFGLET